MAHLGKIVVPVKVSNEALHAWFRVHAPDALARANDDEMVAWVELCRVVKDAADSLLPVLRAVLSRVASVIEAAGVATAAFIPDDERDTPTPTRRYPVGQPDETGNGDAAEVETTDSDAAEAASEASTDDETVSDQG